MDAFSKLGIGVVEKIIGYDVKNTMRFELFAVLVAALISSTYMIFRYLL